MDWYNKPATKKQIDYIRKLGYDGEIPEKRGLASELIDQLQIRRDEALAWVNEWPNVGWGDEEFFN